MPKKTSSPVNPVPAAVASIKEYLDNPEQLQNPEQCQQAIALALLVIAINVNSVTWKDSLAVSAWNMGSD